jgi:hypothetical protein
MTIAACYVSPEGIVFGADSTSTYSLSAGLPFLPPKERHYNFGQKIFEIGKGSTLAVVTWGLGGLTVGSYRTPSPGWRMTLKTIRLPAFKKWRKDGRSNFGIATVFLWFRRLRSYDPSLKSRHSMSTTQTSRQTGLCRKCIILTNKNKNLLLDFAWAAP